MPNRVFVGLVGLLLIGLGVNAVRTGSIAGRIGSVQGQESPAWFWLQAVLYAVLGMFCLDYAWRDR